MRVFILGLPGSGKGTISSLLRQEAKRVLNSEVPYFNVGELLRQKSNEDVHIKNIHAAGGLVNSDRVTGIFEQALSRDHFICDGSPRKAQEAEFILSHPNWTKSPGILVYLKIPEAVVFERLLRRQRFDDNEAIIQNRIKAFNEETIFSISKFQAQNRLLVADGTLSPTEIVNTIIDKLHELN